MTGERRPSGRRRRLLLGLSGAVPVLAVLGEVQNLTLLVYSMFVGSALLRRRGPRPDVRRASPKVFAAAFVAAGLLVEVLAWISEFLVCNPQPALLHPQLIPNLLIAVGFYGAGAAAWLIALRRYRFTPGEAFVAHGILGVFVEQQGGMFLAGLAAFPVGTLFWLYTFLVYGPIAGLAVRVAPDLGGPHSGWSKYPAVWLLSAALMVVGALVWAIVLSPLGIPEARGICEAPLW